MWFKKNIISAQVVKKRADRVKKRALKAAKKQIKRGELADSKTLELHLSEVRSHFIPLLSDVKNSTSTLNSAKKRARIVAKNRQLIDFFSHNYVELTQLKNRAERAARDADREDEFKHEKHLEVETSKMKDEFEEIIKKKNNNDKNRDTKS